jgi:hypothetical protein
MRKSGHLRLPWFSKTHWNLCHLVAIWGAIGWSAFLNFCCISKWFRQYHSSSSWGRFCA